MSPRANLAELVHGPLERWSRERADAIALDDGQTKLSFGDLYTALWAVAHTLNEADAPRTVLVNNGQATVHRIVEFLGVIASGRCAAVSDPDWTASTREAVSASLDATPLKNCPPPMATSPFYIGFTSGSTGLPKGFRRHHRSWVDSFQVCIDTFGPDAASRIAVPGRFSHSLFLFGFMLGLWTGAGVVLQEHFSGTRLLDTLRTGETPCLVAVPSQLVVLLDRARRRELAPMDGVRLILISGARWPRERTPALQRLFPNARIIEFYGASETSFIAWMPADEQVPAQIVGRPFGNVDIDVRGAASPGEDGLIYVRSPMVFMDYVGGGDDNTAALRDGDWLSVRDMGRVDEHGRLHLVGRQNRMIVTQGKNLFPEELETVLMAYPGVLAASVHGLHHPVRGQQVVAVLKLDPGANATAEGITAWCRQRLEAYKVPRQFFLCNDWPLTGSGKTNHPRLGALLVTGDAEPWPHHAL
ncbi:AMP-binding protein [Hydrogenophaga sp. BPS33]|uniref:AMP-binding protein n=1 Tax=Hydrogenophaga sp. BPS33 TaxID=2651974 RepID=UPI00131FAAB4|nr:AMP-binding protein [Hydrogenophaga sp. BPS33]QHE83856.1 AMP-binding protein [Hydrogenophaga sp. BPS33]